MIRKSAETGPDASTEGAEIGRVIRLQGTANLGLRPDGLAIVKQGRATKDPETGRTEAGAWLPFIEPAPQVIAWGLVDGEKWVAVTVPSPFGDDSHTVKWRDIRDGSAWEAFANVAAAATNAGREALAAAVAHQLATMPRAVTPVQTGWHVLDGRNVYVTGDACIGAGGVHPVDIVRHIPDVLAGYRLPAPPEGLPRRREVAAASVHDLYNLAAGRAPEVRRHVTAQITHLWLQPVAELFPAFPDFVAGSHGKRESGKSTLVMVAVNHYGTFTKATMPASFKDSAPALREKMYHAKDVLFPVEDYRRTGLARVDDAADGLFDSMISGVARSGSGDRSHRTGAVRASRPVKVVPWFTAEHSVPAELGPERVLQVHVKPRLIDDANGCRTVDPMAIGDASAAIAAAGAGVYREAMADYVRHLAGLRDADEAALRTRVADMLREEHIVLGQHAGMVGASRAGEQVAFLMVGWSLRVEYLVSIGAVTETAGADLVKVARRDLVDLVNADDDNPDKIPDDLWAYRALLDSLATGKAHVLDRHNNTREPASSSDWGWEAAGMGPNRPVGECVGSIDSGAGELILMGDAVMGILTDRARRTKRGFTTKLDGLLEMWEQRGYLITETGTQGGKSRTWRTCRRKLRPHADRVRYPVLRIPGTNEAGTDPAGQQTDPDLKAPCHSCGLDGPDQVIDGDPWHGECRERYDVALALQATAEPLPFEVAPELPDDVDQVDDVEPAAVEPAADVAAAAITPRVWSPVTRRPAAYVDITTGVGVTDDGHMFTTRRSGPLAKRTDGRVSAAAILDATPDTVGVVHLLGLPEMAGPVRTWFNAPVTGWSVTDHYLAKPDTAVGRWVNDASGRRIAVYRIETWFPTPSTPEVARQTMAVILDAVQVAGRGQGGVREADTRIQLFATPAQTGRDLWRHTVAEKIEQYAPLPEDVQRLIRATSGQGRIELFTARDPRPELPGLVEQDLTFGYAGLVREIGSGPAVMLTGPATRDLWTTDPYARGRARVRATVPADWAHIGLLGVKAPDVADGWTYPAAPGMVLDTWADFAEIHLAADRGWAIEFLEGIHLTGAARPLDTWAKRLIEARDRLAQRARRGEVTGEVAGLARSGLRALVLHGIGAFQGSPMAQTRMGNPDDVPADAAGIRLLDDGRMQWTEVHTPTGIPAECAHPEFSATVWARCRRRLLIGPHGNEHEGALSLDPAELVAARTDALYLTRDPGWSSDQVGRFRRKSAAPGPVTTPHTWGQFDALRHQVMGGE